MIKIREANGSKKSFNVRYWGVGNESYGCGGDFTPHEYATEFRKFTSWVPQLKQVERLRGKMPKVGIVDRDTKEKRRSVKQKLFILNPSRNLLLLIKSENKGKDLEPEQEWSQLLDI